MARTPKIGPLARAGFLAAAVAAAPAAGQGCTEQWLPGSAVPGVDTALRAMTTFDFDGPGPRPAELVVASGELRAAGDARVPGIARWDGAAFYPLGDERVDVSALTTLDPDGEGPEPERLVFTGRIFFTPGAPTPVTAFWDGGQWQTLGPPCPLYVRALTSHDPDGAGPLPPELFAGGSEIATGTVRVVRLGAGQWRQAGPPFTSTSLLGINALVPFDADGPGAAPPLLIAGGWFMSIGGTAAAGIAAWAGASWRALDPGPGQPAFSGSIRALAVYDGDGPGPERAEIIAGGLMRVAGPELHAVASWNGSRWRTLGGVFGAYDQVEALCVHDPDRSGRGVLVALGQIRSIGGVPFRGIAAWDSAAWQPLGAGIQITSANGPFLLASHDPDPSGPLPPRLIAACPMTEAGATRPRFIAQWDGDDWSLMARGFNAPIAALAVYAPPSGPPELIAGGEFLHTPDGDARAIAAFDGSAWRDLRGGVDGEVAAMLPWDPDGPAGPQREALAVGGWFRAAGGVPAENIALWDGAAWTPLGSPGVAIHALTAWDGDGPGPLPARLVAAGSDRGYGWVKVWTGAAWEPIGGVFWVEEEGVVLPALAALDPDGPGPAPQELYVGGRFEAVAGQFMFPPARWDGTAWRAVQTGILGECNALLAYDPDSAGPLTPRLAASIGGSVAELSGGVWRPVPINGLSAITALAVHDPDGPGPLNARLLMGGYGPDILSWDSTVVRTHTAPIQGPYASPWVFALASWPRPGSAVPELAAGGYFSVAGDRISANLARWACTDPLPCYADCNSSGIPPAVNIADFICFLNRFAAADPWANCDGSTAPPVFTVADFICYANAFAAGCP